MIEEDTLADLYVVEPLSADASPDKLRAQVEDALDTLSFNFRKFPTLPADASHCLEPLPEAYAANVGIVLPLKHCAFLGCTWCGDDAKSQAVHIVEHHLDMVEEGMDAYKNI